MEDFETRDGDFVLVSGFPPPDKFGVVAGGRTTEIAIAASHICGASTICKVRHPRC